MPAHVIGVFSQKGGVGRTFIATNLALILFERLKKETLLADCKVPYSGDCLLALGERNAASMLDLEDSIAGGKEAWLSRVSRHQQNGIYLLPLCMQVEQVVRVTPELVRESVRLASESVDFVVIDLDLSGSELIAPVLDLCTEVVLVTTPDLLCLNQNLKAIDQLQAHYFPRESILLVVNQQRDSAAIKVNLIEHNLKLRTAAIVSADGAAVENSLNRGEPLAIGDPKHAICRALFNLGESIAGRPIHSRQTSSREPRPAAARAAVLAASAARHPTGSKRTTFGLPLDQLIQLKQRIHHALIEEMNLKQMDYETLSNPDRRLELYRATELVISRLVDKEAEAIAGRDDRVVLARELLNEALGLGPIEYLLADDTVTEIMVNGPHHIYVERKGKLELTPYYFTGDLQLRGIIERIVVQVGRRIDEKSPMVDARLADGSRVNAIISPLTLDGSSLTIRKFAKVPLTVDSLLKFGTLSPQISRFLQACVLARKNVIISGGTGSGKTTLLNILSGFIPLDERVLTIEDSAELQLPQEHVVRLETRPPNIEGEGAITIRDLVRNALRMRPDRIVVGECRGAEALDMLQAMNTGHDGSLTTVHANTPRDALSRLETMCLMAGLDLPARAIRTQIASAVHIVVQQARLNDGSRRVTYVSEVCGMQSDVVSMQDIFLFRQDRVLPDGKVEGVFEATGYIPTFIDTLRPRGIDLPREVFMRQ